MAIAALGALGGRLDGRGDAFVGGCSCLPTRVYSRVNSRANSACCIAYAVPRQGWSDCAASRRARQAAPKAPPAGSARGPGELPGSKILVTFQGFSELFGGFHVPPHEILWRDAAQLLIWRV
jgi:hypothetical protein